MDTDHDSPTAAATGASQPIDATGTADPSHSMSLTTRAILFDLDGTLIDSTPIVVRCWTRWAKEYAVSRADFDRVHTHGRTAAGIISDLLPPEQVEEALRRIVELETVELDGLTALPGAHDLFAAIPLGRRAIVTSGTLDVASARLAYVSLEPGLLVTADDVWQGKPDPEPYLTAAERLGYAASDCLVVEDAPVGLQAARAAGMQTVAVQTTHTAGELDADLVLDHLGQLRVDDTGGALRLSTPHLGGSDHAKPDAHAGS